MSEHEETSAGGWLWERAEAAELMRKALESGDFDALVLAWSRLGDALVNQLLSASARQNLPLREELEAVHDERKEDAASFEHRLMMLIGLATKAQKEAGQIMARLGIAEAAITTTEHNLQRHIDKEDA